MLHSCFGYPVKMQSKPRHMRSASDSRETTCFGLVRFSLATWISSRNHASETLWGPKKD